MGILQPFALGRSVRSQVRVSTDADFGDETAASAVFVGADSFPVLNGYALEHTESREPRRDARANRGIRQELRRKQSINLGVQTYLPLPAAGDAPDIRPLLIAALGQETVVASTSVSYTLLNDLSALNFNFQSEDVNGSRVFGWVCDEMRMTFPNAEEPTIEFSGQATKSLSAGRANVSGAIDGSVTPVATVTVTGIVGVAAGFDLGSSISFTGSVASSLGPHRITAIDYSTGALTITPSITVNVGSSVVAFPHTSYDESQLHDPSTVPLAFVGETVISIGGVAVDYQEANISVANNIDPIDPAGARTPQDFCPGDRIVTGEITLYGSQASLIRRIMANVFQSSATNVGETSMSIVMGETLSGSQRCTITLPRVKFNRSDLDISDPGPATFAMPFQSFAPANLASADNEFTMLFDVVP